MRLLNVRTLKLEEFLGSVPPYAILSHTWGDDNDEISFRDIELGRLDNAANRPRKLVGCCEQALKDQLEYAWVDTCCIDKANAVELSEAINSMFQWYAKATICYAYLSDVISSKDRGGPDPTFFSSRWFTRGWTLQELLAPKALNFYDSSWSFIGTRISLSGAVERITGIPRPFLRGVPLNEASVAQRMSWAAKRVTKREEDMAYCLLGIFGVMMPPIYGEGDQSFHRLQEEIMKKSDDDSILAWGFSPTGATPNDPAPGNALAMSPTDFLDCGRLACQGHSSRRLEFAGGRLRANIPLYTTPTGKTYGILGCGPEQSQEHVVGIPLVGKSSSISDEYFRPRGSHTVLLPRQVLDTVDTSPMSIHIQALNNSVRGPMSRELWFYIDESDTNLELVDVEPSARWQKDSSMIQTDYRNGCDVQHSLVRFRLRTEVSHDFIAVLEFKPQGQQSQARCHLMVSDRETTLAFLSQKLAYMRQEAFGTRSASNGILHISATVQLESVAGQPMFVVRLATMARPPEMTVNAAMESRRSSVTALLQSKLEEESAALSNEGDLRMIMIAFKAEVDFINDRLRKLDEERRSFVERLEMCSQELNTVRSKCDAVTRVGDRARLERLQLQRVLDLVENPADTNPLSSFDDMAQELLLWAAEFGHEAVVWLLLENGADIETKSSDGLTALHFAAKIGHEAVVRLLLEKAADVEAGSSGGLTALHIAAGNGHEAVVRLLLEKGADIKEKENSDGWTALYVAARNGHEAVVRLLLEKGADIEAKTNMAWTALHTASRNGHEVVVRLLLEKGADIRARENSDGWTALYVAAWNGHEAVVRLLLEKGADIEAKTNRGRTALHAASRNGHEAVVRLLLDGGAYTEAKNHTHGRTALYTAAQNGHEAVVRLLLEKGADIEANYSSRSWTALHIAAKKGHEAVVRLLLEMGADITAKETGNSRTALDIAAENENEGVVRLLLEKGSSIKARNM